MQPRKSTHDIMHIQRYANTMSRQLSTATNGNLICLSRSQKVALGVYAPNTHTHTLAYMPACLHSFRASFRACMHTCTHIRRYQHPHNTLVTGANMQVCMCMYVRTCRCAMTHVTCSYDMRVYMTHAGMYVRTCIALCTCPRSRLKFKSTPRCFRTMSASSTLRSVYLSEHARMRVCVCVCVRL